MYLFSGIIKCTNCGKNYRGKTERKKKVYICNGYSNNNSICKKYYKVDENDLIDIINQHLKIHEIKVSDNNLLKNYVNKIEVNSVEESIIIYYKDNTTSIFNKNRLKF